MEKPIRVLHVIGSLDYGGSQSFIMELYRCINKEIIQFDFVIFKGENKGFYNEVLALGGIVYECPKYKLYNHYSFKKWWIDFFKEHAEYRIIHSHVRSIASIYLSLAKRKGLVTIAHSHSTSNGVGIASTVKDYMQKSIYKYTDYFFACSHEAGEWLFGKQIINNANFRIIPNAINSQRFVFNETIRNKVRNELNLNTNFVIGHVGRLTKVKNHDFILDVFKKSLELIPNAKLLLVGDGEERKRLEDKVKENKLTNEVIFLGSKCNTEDYYQAMDLFLFPSFWEGLGIVLIEAQTSGLKCVVSNTIPRLVDLKAGLIDFLDINSPINTWVNKIVMNQYYRRQSTNIYTILAGFDVKMNAQYFQQFYLSIY